MRLACAGGGTLGSVTPLLAVLEELGAAGTVAVDWFGTATGPERELVAAAGYQYHQLSGGKLRRYLSFENVTDLVRIAVDFVRTLAWFTQHKVDALLTAGSFVAVPVGWAAWFAGVPVFVHQQDVRPGLANKLLAPVARRITVTLAASLASFPVHKTVLTGNPVRRAFATPHDQAAAQRSLDLAASTPTVVVVGGGTGAEFFNRTVAAARSELTQLAQVVHITGRGRGSVPAVSEHYLPLEFTQRSLDAFASADVVVTRAGMGVLSELAALRRAAIVVPIPNSHQEDNARLLHQHGAALVLEQRTLTPEVLLGTVRQLLNDQPMRERYARALSELLPAGGSLRVAQEVRTIIER